MTLGKRALQGTVFVAVSTYLCMGITFVSSIVLARILLPEHFGVVALATFFLELFGRVREFGFDQALIHRQEDLEEAFSAHFVLRIGTALLSLILALAAAPILNNFYNPETVRIFLVLSVFVVFQAASATPRIALEKELLFKRTTVVDALSLFFSSLLAIFLALRGFGLWSLVVGNVSNTFFAFLGLFLVSPWRFRIKLNKKISGWFLKFGFFLWLGGLTTFILFKYNDFIAGTFLGAAVLGFYAKAFNLAQLPTSSITSVVSRVALPTYAKVQNDVGKLSLSFNIVLRNVVRISAPLCLFLFLFAPDLVLFLFGPKWTPMVPIFRLLIIYSFLRSIFDDAGAFLTAMGKPQLVSIYLTVQAVIILGLTPLLVSVLGVNGAALSLDVVLLIGTVMAYFYVSRLIVLEGVRAFFPALLAVAFASLFWFWIVKIFPSNGPSLVSLLQAALVGLCYLVLILLVEGKLIFADWRYLKAMLKKGEE